MKKETWKTLGTDIIYDILGGALYSLGIYTFAVNAHFAPVGTSGLAVILNYLFSFPIGITGLLLDVYKRQGFILDKKTCFFFLFVTFLYGVAQYTYMPILSSYAQTLGAGAFLVGFITGMNGTVSLFLRLPFSFLSDYLHKRKIFITASILFTFLAALIVCFWQSPASLIISRALAGVSMSTWVHYTVLFASYYPKEKMGYAVGMVNAIIVLGDFAGTFLCGFLAPRFGEISTYLAAALLALAALILCLLFIKEKVPEKQGHLSLPELFSVMKMPVVVFYSVLSAVALYIFFATGPAFTPLVAVENFAADQVQLSVLSALSLAATFASCLLYTSRCV